VGIEAEILRHYAQGPALLEAVVAGLGETDLDRRLDEHSWSIRQIIHHLADWDDIWKVCIKRRLAILRGSLIWDGTGSYLKSVGLS
jgi:hypothetical protein